MKQTSGIISEYHQYYINLINTEDIIGELKQQSEELVNYLTTLSEQQGDYAYAEGKWSIKEMVGHLADCERVFAYRTLRFVRNDKTPLHSFEQDDYIAAANFNKRTLVGLIDELRLIRAANLALFKTFNAEELDRSGTVSTNFYTVKSLLLIIAGHEKHHFNILRQKYFTAQ